MITPQHRMMEFSDGAVSYLEWEAAPGAPTLVFVHANGFNAATYRTLLSPLAGRFRIAAPDLRGHGRTTLAADPALIKSWATHRDDLLHFLDGLGGKPVLLAGHSMGATTSLLTVAARPGLARALVMTEPVMVPDGVAYFAKLLRLLGLDDRISPLVAQAKRRRARFATREEALSAFRGRGAFRNWPDAVVADYVEGGLTEDGNGGFKLACAPEWEAVTFSIFPAGLASLGRRIDAPVTILQGTERSTAAASVVRSFARNHHNTRLVGVPGASHFLPMEQPEIVREEILRAAATI